MANRVDDHCSLKPRRSKSCHRAISHLARVTQPLEEGLDVVIARLLVVPTAIWLLLSCDELMHGDRSAIRSGLPLVMEVALSKGQDALPDRATIHFHPTEVGAQDCQRVVEARRAIDRDIHHLDCRTCILSGGNARTHREKHDHHGHDAAAEELQRARRVRNSRGEHFRGLVRGGHTETALLWGQSIARVKRKR